MIVSSIIYDLRHKSMSSINDIIEANELLVKLVSDHPEEYLKRLLDFNTMKRKEAVILIGFFFKTFPEHDKQRIWSFVNRSNIPGSVIREMALSLNLHFIRTRMNCLLVYSEDAIISKYITCDIVKSSFESIEIDIQHIVTEFFINRSIFDMCPVTNNIINFILYTKITNMSYKLFISNTISLLIEKCDIKTNLNVDTIKLYLKDVTMLIMCRLILDSSVENTYKKTKQLHIVRYMHLYKMVNKGMKVYEANGEELNN